MERILLMAPPGQRGQAPRYLTTGASGEAGGLMIVANISACYSDVEPPEPLAPVPFTATSFTGRHDQDKSSSVANALDMMAPFGEPWDPRQPTQEGWTPFRHVVVDGSKTMLKADGYPRLGLTLLTTYWRNYTLGMVLPGRFNEPPPPEWYWFEYEPERVPNSPPEGVPPAAES